MTFFNSLFRNKTEFPDFWLSYIKALDEKIPGSTFLDDIPFVVFDTETSGFSIEKDKLVSIGAVKLMKGQIWIDESFERNIHYTKPSKSIEVHGILPDRNTTGPDETEVVVQLIKYIGNAVLVGHHIGFDLAFINKVLSDNYKVKLKSQYIDTAQFALKLENLRIQPGSFNPEDYTLDALCDRYKIVPADRHTAAGDAFLTAQLLQKLLAKAKKSGINTYRKLFL